MTGATPQPERLLVGICTFRRDSLRDTLRSLAALDPRGAPQLAVVVADNDDTPSAQLLVEELAPALPFPVTYLHAPARNISIARNAILAHAQAGGHALLAFLDDDETVDPGWAGQIMAARVRSGCAAVVGPVLAAYGAGAPEWMRAGNLHHTRPDLDAAGHAHTGYTCNVLLDLSDPRLGALRFGLERGRSGGEDTAYFARYRAAGGRIGYAPEAIVRETVPPERARLGWLLRRRYRMGQTHGALLCEGGGTFTRARQAGLAGLKVLYCAGATVAAPFDTLRRNRALLRGALHAGAISGCFGRRELQIYGAADETPSKPRGQSERGHAEI